MKILIIIPTYNEKDNIENILKEIIDAHPKPDILVIDDNSPDGTGQIADDMSNKYNRIKVVHRTGKMGLGTAYIEGFKKAMSENYDYVFEMDADFSHDPKDIPRFIKAIKNNDLVIGSRYVPKGRIVGWGLIRYAISMGGNILARLILKLPIKDCTTGFRCYRITALKQINLDNISSEGYGFQVELVFLFYINKLKIHEIPITFIDRQIGKSKMSKNIIIEAFIKLIQLRKEYTS